MPSCNIRFALWLYRTGLWRGSENIYVYYHFDPMAKTPKDGLREPCTYHEIVHFGNMGTTYGFDGGHDYWVPPPTDKRHKLHPDSWMKENGWHDGSTMKLCFYRERRRPYGYAELAGREAWPIR